MTPYATQTLGCLPTFKLTLACIQILLCYRKANIHVKSVTQGRKIKYYEIHLNMMKSQFITEGRFCTVPFKSKGEKKPTNQDDLTTMNSGN